MKSNHVFPIPFPIPLAGLALAELMEGTVSTSPMPEVRQVIFSPPATIVHWSDVLVVHKLLLADCHGFALVMSDSLP